jgi:hypothetical protein
MSSRVSKFLCFISLAVLVVSILAYVSILKPSDTNTPTPEPFTKVRIGYLRIAASLPLFVAIEERIFEKYKLDVELFPFNSSNELAIADATQRIDIMASCAVNAALDASSVSGRTPTVFLINQYQKMDKNGRPTDHLIARKGHTLDSLKGKSIAFFPGSVSKVFAKEIFANRGFNLEDFTYVEMNPPEWLPALKSGRIEAVNAIEPSATLILDDPNYESLISGFFSELQPDVPLSAFWFSSGLEKTTRNAIQAVFRESLDIIETQGPSSLVHFGKYTSIPSDVYPRIGLNKWQLTRENPQARSTLQAFVDHLDDTNAILAIPKDPWYE